MNRTIEEAYFKAFQQLANDCISYILKSGLKQTKPELQAVYETTLLLHCGSVEQLQAAIAKDFEQYKKTNKQKEISEEIESNIDSITDQAEQLKYLFSLLTPFKEFCRAIHPIGHQPKEKADISGCSWERLERSKQNFIEGEKDLKYSWLSKIVEQNKYYELLYIKTPIEKGTIKYYLRSMLLGMNTYSNRLYAVLIKRGIELKDIQEKAGIYLKSNWVADDIAPYIGGVELAQYYIDEAERKKQQAAVTTATPVEQTDKNHFNAPCTKKQLTTIFQRLISGGYLHPDSNLKDWLIVCGADETQKAPTKPLNWMKAQNILAWLIYQLFEDVKRWEITERVFCVKGKKPNTNAMKNDVSKVKNECKDKPKAFNELESLLKDI